MPTASPYSPKARRRVLWAVAIAASIVAAPGGDGRVGAKARPIDELKAAYAYQFTSYVEWPEAAFESEDTPFRICVIGNEQLYDYLSLMTKEKTFDGRAIEVSLLETVSSIEGCHLLFVGEDAPDFDELGLETLEVAPLTVGDSKTFTKDGGIIRLYEASSRVRIEINIDAAKRNQYKISSKLLQLADIVHDE